MRDNRFFADVDLPFHVWVREGDRWVLRAAPQAPQCDEADVPEVSAALIARHATADGRTSA